MDSVASAGSALRKKSTVPNSSAGSATSVRTGPAAHTSGSPRTICTALSSKRSARAGRYASASTGGCGSGAAPSAARSYTRVSASVSATGAGTPATGGLTEAESSAGPETRRSAS